MQNAIMDSLRVSELSASDATHEKAAQDSTAVDDGNARDGSTASPLRFSCRYPQTYKVLPWYLLRYNNHCLNVIVSSSIESQSKVEVMELSDLHHHPNCKINRKPNSDLGVGVGGDSCRRESESSDSILLSPEASKATEAVEFIAEHLRNEDLYIQVGYRKFYFLQVFLRQKILLVQISTIYSL